MVRMNCLYSVVVDSFGWPKVVVASALSALFLLWALLVMFVM